MADLSDVCNALVDLISATVYPNGVDSPSIAGIDCSIFAGWPDPNKLDGDLNSVPPVANVSVFPRQEEENTTRYMETWQELSRNVATLTLTQSGQHVTVGGTVPSPITSNPHNLVIFVNRVPYVYAVRQGDTLTACAQALAALIPGASYSGAVVTMTPTAAIGALRVGITGVAVEEIARQKKLFQIGIWAATPQGRDKLASSIDVALKKLNFVTLADQSAARIIYVRSLQLDSLQKDKLYRRDLFFSVEYPTLDVETETEITETALNLSAEIASVPPAIPLGTTYE